MALSLWHYLASTNSMLYDREKAAPLNILKERRLNLVARNIFQSAYHQSMLHSYPVVPVVSSFCSVVAKPMTAALVLFWCRVWRAPRWKSMLCKASRGVHLKVQRFWIGSPPVFLVALLTWCNCKLALAKLTSLNHLLGAHLQKTIST